METMTLVRVLNATAKECGLLPHAIVDAAPCDAAACWLREEYIKGVKDGVIGELRIVNRGFQRSQAIDDGGTCWAEFDLLPVEHPYGKG